ncbi:MAG: hypothetical protein ACETVY_00930 [Candidatus Bathyarchaeia archaeon]
MSEVVRRHLPLAITFVAGVIMILEYYTPAEAISSTADVVNTWRTILAVVVYVGTINLVRLHARNVQRRRPGQWYFSAWLIFLIFAWTAMGLYWGVNAASYRWFVDNVNVALSSTMYASLCFYMAAGAYRVLKFRNLGTGLLLLSAFLVIVGNTPLFPAIWPGFAEIRNKIFDTFVVGSYRAIRIGVGVSGVALGIRTIFGLETGYLGRRKE